MFQHVTVLASFIFAIALTHGLLAGLGKPRWLQWVGVGGLFVQKIWYFISYGLGS